MPNDDKIPTPEELTEQRNQRVDVLVVEAQAIRDGLDEQQGIVEDAAFKVKAFHRKKQLIREELNKYLSKYLWRLPLSNYFLSQRTLHSVDCNLYSTC